MNDNIFLNNNLEQLLENSQKEVHITIQQRNGRKCWTFIEGLDKLMDNENNSDITKYLENLSKQLKKKFNCSVCVKIPENILQMSGDHREGLKEYLTSKNICEQSQIKIHGI